jgi:hypothetical protein
MKVGMPQFAYVTTGATPAAGRVIQLPRFTKEELPEPECEALFANASRAVDEEARGERPAAGSAAEAVA